MTFKKVDVHARSSSTSAASQDKNATFPLDTVDPMGEVTSINVARPRVLEFFAGIGLARMGLESAGFRVAWANDFEADKKAMYEAQFAEDPEHTFSLGDIARTKVSELPKDASLAWASSPCTDLSLAGARAGFAGAQSGTFWHFIQLLTDLGKNRPDVVVLENVTGLASSHGGDDLTAAIRAFNQLGYSIDVLALDARRFLPQSRPRLFLVGAQNPPTDNPDPNSELRPDWLQWVYGDKSLRTHRAALPTPPKPKTEGLGELIEDMPLSDERWWDESRTTAFIGSLSPTQRDRVMRLRRTSGVKYRTAYRRTRKGTAVWEVRPDDVSGCLRTARGGSSKQAVVRLGNKRLQVRWMTPLEYARLMGAGDYNLDSARTNQALFGFGDAVAVPAVAWLAENYLMPLVKGDLVTLGAPVDEALNG
ncbi:DNA cytosine methyltransferase [Citricoccus muralis]|uniref:DNA (cytosine-5-)-methyltransferase n=1 Tax=Citricoccus muralis TaxID=169134 RepID=A0ABY8HAE9_9MICC|nr:DNA cytosine methyltransferase [Citricoccus muralis]WFP17638.1 DNA cytosine methyltransferase [Citricoccus muralis]